MGTYESERIDGNKKSTKYEEENKRNREKGVKTLLFYFSTGSFTCMCVCVRVYVFSVLLFTNHRFFMSHFLFDNIYDILGNFDMAVSFIFTHIYVHWSCFDRGRIHTCTHYTRSLTQIQTVLNYWIVFSFPFFFYSIRTTTTKKTKTKKNERSSVCSPFEIIHDQFIHTEQRAMRK